MSKFIDKKEDLLMLFFALLIICPDIFGGLADNQLVYFVLIFMIFSGDKNIFSFF